jgi:hypothetical protein
MLVLIAATTVDSYQTRLLMVAKGVVTPSKFLAEENPEGEEAAENTDEDEGAAEDEAGTTAASASEVITADVPLTEGAEEVTEE